MSSVPMPGAEGLAHHQQPEAEAPAAAIPFGQQIANIAPFIEQAARHVCPDDVDADEIARMAIERFAGIGALEHGDAMFHLTAEELLDEEKAEYADAVVYRARRLALAPAGVIYTTHRLTDEEVERIREQWRAQYTGPGAPIILTPIQPPDIVDMVTGYDESNRAEALHPPQGDA